MSKRLLLTPGPLTTADATRAAMQRDWGSRDTDFIALTARVRERLVAICHGGDDYSCIPLQGSGTFAVEAMLGTFVGPTDKLLVLENGAYGRRASAICRRMSRAHVALSWDEDTPVDTDQLSDALAADPSITHVLAVHVETTSGLLNPITKIGAAVAATGRHLLIDAMSAFGALPLSATEVEFDAVAASANKCIEGVPGIGFVIARNEALETTAGHSPATVLDLYEQWRGFEANGQWRFTPPTHVLAAFDAALDGFEAEGGVAGRGGRYRQNCRILTQGLTALGLKLYLEPEVQAPIIVTVHQPTDPNFDFDKFYDSLGAQGLVIYPGKLTKVDSFRIGCIGQVFADDMARVVTAVGETLAEMGVRLSPETS